MRAQRHKHNIETTSSQWTMKWSLLVSLARVGCDKVYVNICTGGRFSYRRIHVVGAGIDNLEGGGAQGFPNAPRLIPPPWNFLNIRRE